MRISSRPKHSAAVCESLTSQPDGRVELRPHVLQADDCGELDELCRITVGPQPLHKLVVNGGRRRGHGLGVLHDQALQRTEHLAIAPMRHRLDLLARYAAPVQHPVAEVHAPRAADVERFDGTRSHLRAVAYRMLGSLSEADAAAQEAWLRSCND
jgi:hypothetical protein